MTFPRTWTGPQWKTPGAVALERDKRKADRKAIDEKGSRIARARAGGRCEVTVDGKRCRRADNQTHHHLGGFGVRGRGESAKAKHKTRTCTKCHDDITAKRLLHVEGNVYRRATG